MSDVVAYSVNGGMFFSTLLYVVVDLKVENVHWTEIGGNTFLNDARQLEVMHFPFPSLDASAFLIAKCFYSYKDDFLKKIGKINAYIRMQKVYF